MKNLKCYIIILIGILLAACNDNAPEGANPSLIAHFLQLDQYGITFTAKEASTTINVESENTSWRITGMPDWVIVTPSSGNSSAVVTLSVTHNISVANNRSCVLILKSEDPEYPCTRSIDILQDKEIAVEEVTLDKTSITLDKGESISLIATVSPDNAFDKSLTWESSNTSVATVDSDGKITAINSGVATITVTSVSDFNMKATCEIFVIDRFNGHAYVDLGLPSGTLWATCNVGAALPEQYGDYYAWGETETKTIYNYKTYKWYKEYLTLTKYCYDSSYGIVDNKTILDLEDDVAHVKWGGKWRMPTKEEQDELRNPEYCTWTWTTQNGVNGCKVTSKSNGNSLFLPAAGLHLDSHLSDVGAHGDYLSSSLETDIPDLACFLRFDSGGVHWGSVDRDNGRSVRPVCSPRIYK